MSSRSEIAPIEHARRGHGEVLRSRPVRVAPVVKQTTMRLLTFGTILAFHQSIKSAETNSAAFPPQQIQFYETRILPILSENCFKCHSHQADKIKGSFVLDSREGLLKGGETGPAIVPGEPERSLLIKAVRHTDED